MENGNADYARAMLAELSEIYRKEGGGGFLPGIFAVIEAISESRGMGDARFREAASIYRTLAGSKSGFSDFYIDRATSEERVIENIRLDYLRQELWKIFGY